MNNPMDKPIDTAELEGFETWLRTRVVDSPPSGVERIKLRVQLAAHEEAMRRSMPRMNARGATERMKHRVRETLAAASGGAARSARITRIVWWSGISAMAAAVGFAFVLFSSQPGVTRPDAPDLMARNTSEAMDETDALDLTWEDDLEGVVTALEESLDDLETGLAEGWDATSDDLFDPGTDPDESSPQPDRGGDKSGHRTAPGERFTTIEEPNNVIVECVGANEAKVLRFLKRRGEDRSQGSGSRRG